MPAKSRLTAAWSRRARLLERFCPRTARLRGTLAGRKHDRSRDESPHFDWARGAGVLRRRGQADAKRRPETRIVRDRRRWSYAPRGFPLPGPREAIYRWHHDAARQKESIPSLATGGGRRENEPRRLKRRREIFIGDCSSGFIGD